MDSTRSDPTRVRTAELIASVCLATDLGMGFPFEHGLHSTLMAMRLCEVLGVDAPTAQQAYYITMLVYSGCTTDAEDGVRIFGGPQTENLIPVLWGSRSEIARGLIRALPPPGHTGPARTAETVRRLPRLVAEAKPHQKALCEVGEMLARQLGLPPEIHRTFSLMTERWDGRGLLKLASGEEIPRALRIALVARDAAFQTHLGGVDHAVTVIESRAGRSFDPTVAMAFAANARDVTDVVPVGFSAWSMTLDAEPRPRLMLEGEAIDDALAAVGHLTDLLAPTFSGHSDGVARLAATAARLVGMSEHEAHTVGRAGHVHDVGRVGVDPRVWLQPRSLTSDEREQVRLHPYYSERVLIQSPFLADLAAAACDHHERLDGSGYHRGVPAQLQSPAGRLLAAADAFHAMTEPRPHRPPHEPRQAADRLSAAAAEGRLDPQMVAAVIEAAGHTPPTIAIPAGLTEREAQVIGLVARGLQTKQVAHRLGISPKTADTHIQHAYRKMGVSTRAAATLFAMEHGLVASGELPIPG